MKEEEEDGDVDNENDDGVHGRGVVLRGGWRWLSASAGGERTR